MRALSRLYAASRLQVSLCQPSFKLKSKCRIGAKVRKIWDRPQTPADRLLARTDIAPTIRERVIALRAASDPVELMRLVRQAQGELGRRVDRRGEGAAAGATAEPPPDIQAPSARDIARAKAPGELHRRAYRRKKPVPPKPSRLDPFAADVRVWLSLDPALTALAIHERLAVRQGSLVSSRDPRSGWSSGSAPSCSSTKSPPSRRDCTTRPDGPGPKPTVTARRNLASRWSAPLKLDGIRRRF